MCFGQFGDDPFIAPIEGREHVIAVCRDANETAPLFAETWHSDWSFQSTPPSGTCLFGITIPPIGGDTWFADQHIALKLLPADLRAKLEGKQAIHSAAGAYAPDGFYGEEDKISDRSMNILPSDEARETHLHPIIRKHPETGEEGLFSCLGYIVGIEGLEQEEAVGLLREIYQYQGHEKTIYKHKWGMIVCSTERRYPASPSFGSRRADSLLVMRRETNQCLRTRLINHSVFPALA